MFKSIFTNSIGILFSRILGFIRDILTASTLGASIYSDIFFIAFKLPNLFRRIFAEGAFTQVFIPSYAKSNQKAIFLAHIFTIFLSIIIILSLLVTMLPSLATRVIALGFDEKTIELASPYVIINFWYLPLIFAITFLSTLLQYKRHFATTAFSTGLLNISLIGALLLSKNSGDEVIVYYLSWGVVVGGVLQLIVHIIAIKKLKLCKLVYGGFKHIRAKIHKIKDEAKTFKKQFLPAIWGNSSAQVNAFIDTWLASFLVSGSISYLYYANRIFQLPLALFAIATSIALFPSIAKFIKNKDEQKALYYLKKAFWFLAFLLGFSTVGAYVLSEPIVKLLFERGAFSAKDTANSAFVLQMYMIGLLPFGLQKLISLWLYSKELQMRAAKIATFTLITNVIFSLILITSMGAAGLALATTLSGLIGFYQSVKVFGMDNFLFVLRDKKTPIFLISMVVFATILYYLKDIISVYI